MDLQDEVRLAMATYAVRGLPQAPDRALLPPGAPLGPATWYARLTPTELARMRRAIELGGRGSFSWTERDQSR